MNAKLASLKMHYNLVYAKSTSFLLAAEIVQEQRVLLAQAMQLLDEYENKSSEPDARPVSSSAPPAA